VLVADEITAALDAEHRERLATLLERERREHGTATIVVSHDLEVVGRTCASTVVMDDGTVVDEGPTAEVLARTG
jgi:ABC-type glutathione transport system ATPase component